METKPGQRIMAFDVETTGLIPRCSPKSLNEYPHILQLSFVVYDTTIRQIVKSVDLYVNVSKEVEISPKITEITGITRKICEEHGVTIKWALTEFYDEFMKCDCIVSHNFEFDSQMVDIEMRRIASEDPSTDKNWSNIFDPNWLRMNNKQICCTMERGRNICKIEQISKTGRVYYKNPKLIELYEHIYGTLDNDMKKNLHNSLVDSYLCLRCFIGIL